MLVFGSIVVGVTAMLAFVSNLPRRFRLEQASRGPKLRAGTAALAVAVPLCVSLACFIAGSLLTWAEGWNLWKSFRFIIGTSCGLGNPLIIAVPSTVGGRIVAIIVGVASRGAAGVIVGIMGGVGAIVAGVNRFSAALSPEEGEEDEDAPSTLHDIEAIVAPSPVKRRSSVLRALWAAKPDHTEAGKRRMLEENAAAAVRASVWQRDKLDR